MSVSKPAIPLSYGNQKAIFHFIPFSQRKLLARRCPKLIVIDDIVPYKLRTLKITYTKDKVSIEIQTEIKVSWDIYNCSVVRNYLTFKKQKPRDDKCPVPMWKKNIFETLLRKYIDRPGTEIDTIMINGFHCNINMRNLIKISDIHLEMKEGYEVHGLVDFLGSLNHWCRHKYGYLSLTHHHKSLMSHEIFLKMQKIKVYPWFGYDFKYLMELEATEIMIADHRCRFLNPRISNADYLTLAEFWVNKNRPIGFMYRSAYSEDFEELKSIAQEVNWSPKFVERQKCINKTIDEHKEINIYIDRNKHFNIRILPKGTAIETLPPIPPKIPSCRVAPTLSPHIVPTVNQYPPPKRGTAFCVVFKFIFVLLAFIFAFACVVAVLIWLGWNAYTYFFTGYIFRCPTYRCLKQVFKDVGLFFICLVKNCEIPAYFEPLDPE